MAERYEVDVIANVQQYIKPLSELPAITKANAEKAALALATSLGSVEGAAAEATAKVQAFNKSLIEQGVSEKAAAAATLKYASSLASAGNQAAQATTATGNLGKQADVATERVGNTAQAAVGLGRQLSDVASQLTTGTNPLTILIQQGPQAADAVMMAGFSISKIASAIPPLALAVAALAAGYSVLANATYDAEQAQLDLAVSFDGTLAAAQKMQAAALDVERAHKATTDSQTEAALSLAVMTGQLEEYEVAAGAASRAVVDGAAEERQARQELNAMIGARVEVLRRAIAADETDSSQKPKLIQQHRELTAAYQENIRELRTLENETALLAGAVGAATVEAGKAKEAEDAAAKARQAHEKAIRAQEEALRRLSAAMQAENDLAERSQKTYQGALDALATVTTAQEQAAMAEGERADAAYRATLRTIQAQENQALSVTNTLAGEEEAHIAAERAREAARVAHVEALKAIDEKRNQDQARALAAAEAAQKAAADRMRSMWMGVNQSIAGVFETMTGSVVSSATAAINDASSQIARLEGQIDDLTATTLTHADVAALEGDALVKAYKEGSVAAKDLSVEQRRQVAQALLAEQQAQKQREEDAKKAALTAYKIQKGTAIATTLINAVLQVSNAAAAIPYPANIPGIIAATAMGAAQVATAAAAPPPKFHQGTLDAGPRPGAARRGNEFTAVLEEGEAVIPRATMQQPGAKEQAAALVSGRSPVASTEIAKGMDSSSVPYYLEQLVRLARRPAANARQARPGHKPRYGTA